ncbi:UrcA family protein [Maricaulis sp.]|uniref:UrcA family protein n=1 Tax=Maricaulis sp. TaxID=1486257 RepID=UPI0025C62C41|nr:UrcA family protein [Maricaulis sp.]
MRHPIFVPTVGLFALATALAGPAGNSAAEPPAHTLAEIPFEAADLTDPARYQSLRGRIETAARNVCRAQLLGDLLRPVALTACIRDSTARALDQLELHRSRALTLAEASTTDQG